MPGALSSGMTADEAVRRAALWWDAIGRHMVPGRLNTVEDRKVTIGGGPMIVAKDTHPDLPSGILRGLPWDDLGRNEKARVVRAWRDQHAEREPQATGLMQVLDIACDHPMHPADVERTARFTGPTQRNVVGQARAEGWLITARRDICPLCALADLRATGDA